MQKLLTASQVADLIGASTWRVYELARLGLIPVVRIGRTVRFSESALNEWIRSGGNKLGERSSGVSLDAA